MNQEIKIQITDSLGFERWVKWCGFSNWDHERQEAEMLCKVILIDGENKVSNADIQQDRLVRIEISNRNRVDQEGVLIPHDNENWATGIPEYDFYFVSFMLNNETNGVQVLMYAMTKLDEHLRFERV